MNNQESKKDKSLFAEIVCHATISNNKTIPQEKNMEYRERERNENPFIWKNSDRNDYSLFRRG